jgi:hypothetical protein
MRTTFRTSSLRPHRLMRGVLLFIGLFAVIALAMLGAVIALGVLAVGAVVHGVFSLLGATRSGARAGTRSSRVIEGEFRVIDAGGRGG